MTELLEATFVFLIAICAAIAEAAGLRARRRRDVAESIIFAGRANSLVGSGLRIDVLDARMVKLRGSRRALRNARSIVRPHWRVVGTGRHAQLQPVRSARMALRFLHAGPEKYTNTVSADRIAVSIKS